MRISSLLTPLILLLSAHFQVSQALFITSSTTSTPASPASALQASSTSFSRLSSLATSSSTLAPPTTTETDEARITPKPDFKPGDELELSLKQKWHITTYYSCVTFGQNRVFCGWHEPVRPGGDEIAAANGRLDTTAAALAAGALVFAFAVAL
ncbi:hypothetical protein ONS95_005995 [Cadophora gregata]|uniref:uncharacterized protein n=1 Tax=Cadophora gregata TaxID=51156 RepID=UPI0026DD5727|nr:uncharacterized protein ONS95_005995 [Cadophora gregata]KAK0102373.1 hypothetical protein ONS95_005995 [Cadophora gregata]